MGTKSNEISYSRSQWTFVRLYIYKIAYLHIFRVVPFTVDLKLATAGQEQAVFIAVAHCSRSLSRLFLFRLHGLGMDTRTTSVILCSFVQRPFTQPVIFHSNSWPCYPACCSRPTTVCFLSSCFSTAVVSCIEASRRKPYAYKYFIRDKGWFRPYAA